MDGGAPLTCHVRAFHETRVADEGCRRGLWMAPPASFPRTASRRKLNLNGLKPAPRSARTDPYFPTPKRTRASRNSTLLLSIASRVD